MNQDICIGVAIVAVVALVMALAFTIGFFCGKDLLFGLMVQILLGFAAIPIVMIYALWVDYF